MGVPDGLGASGRVLWDECRGDTLHAAHRGLVLQACRLLDRLDNLADQLGDPRDLLVAVQTETGGVELVVDRALAELRQCALAYGKLIDQLRRLGVVREHRDQTQGPSLIEQLQQARAAREQRHAAS